MGIKALTPENREKMRLGRERYWAEQRKLKELIPQVDELQGTIYAMADKQPKPLQDNGRALPSTAREFIINRINRKREKIIDTHIDIATGYFYTTEDGKHVYTKKPDASANEYLLNQLIGKPKESIEVKTVNLNVDI